MISIYRWNSTSKQGGWLEIPALVPGQVIPDDECWWIDLEDPSTEEETLVLSNWLKVHPLTVEDIITKTRPDSDAPHFPKVEEFNDYLFVIANPLRPDIAERDGECGSTQLSGILTRRVLVTHHPMKLAPVDDVKQFLFRHSGVASRGPDYIFHLIMDAMVDQYAPQIDQIADRLDEIETEMYSKPQYVMLSELLAIKRRVIHFRKTLVLEREVLARLIRGEFELVDEREIVYYRNVFDHLSRYAELVETCREMVSDLMQTHLAAMSNKMNGIMKVLTMVSTTIMPMALVAGVYGMNFKHMPELEWASGYYFALGIMAALGLGALSLFWYKKWV